jgi:hypothetical protein
LFRWTSAEEEAFVASAKELTPMDAQLVEATIKIAVKEQLSCSDLTGLSV